MTLATAYPRNIHIGNGTLGPYTMTDPDGNPVYFESASHVQLIRYASTEASSGTTLAYGTDYTLSGVPGTGVTYTLTTAQGVLASTERIKWLRVQPFAQELDLVNGGDFSAESLEARLSKLEEHIQDVAVTASRGVKSGWRDTEAPELPPVPTDEVKALGRSTNGEILHLTPSNFNSTVLLADGWTEALTAPLEESYDDTEYLTNTAALQAKNYSTSTTPLYVYLSRSHGVEDGGGWFRLDSADTTSADNGGTIIVTASGERYKRQYNGALDPYWFGLTADGVADDSEALQDTVDAAVALGARWIDIDADTIKVNSTTTLTSGSLLITLNNTYVDASELTLADVTNQPDAVWRVTGADAGDTTLSVAAAIRDITITVADASGITTGDIIELQSDSEQWYTNGGTTNYRRHINKVLRKSGNVLTLQQPLPMSFSISTETVAVSYWTPIRSVRILGGEYYGGGVRGNKVNGAGPAVSYITYYDNVEVSPNDIEGFQGHGIRFEYGMNATSDFSNAFLKGHADDYSTAITEDQNSGFYGVFFASTNTGVMRNARGSRLRHIIDGANAEKITGENLISHDGHKQAFTCHDGCTDWTFIDCYGYSLFGGLLWRGHNLTTRGGEFNCLGSSSSAFSDAAGHANDVPKTYKHMGTKFHGSRNAYHTAAHVGNGLIDEACELIGGYASSYYPFYCTSTDHDRWVIKGTVETVATTYCIYFHNNSPNTRSYIELSDGNFIGYSTAASRVFTASGDPCAFVARNNSLNPNGASQAFVMGANHSRWDVRHGNHLHDGSVAPVNSLPTISVASNAITAISDFHEVDTASAAQTLNDINGGAVDGQELVLRTSSSSYALTVSHNAGSTGSKIYTAGSAAFVMSSLYDTLTLVYDKTKGAWREQSRSVA